VTNNDNVFPSGKIPLTELFIYLDIHSDYLYQMLEKVIIRISRSIDLSDSEFGAIHEGATFSGECAEVTEEGDFYINSNFLRKYAEEVAMTIIAHEIAHHYLEYYLGSDTQGLEREYEADEIARKWGFDVDKFREICGQPTI
jgi:Zn-dependent protease with chaperone function